MLSEYSTVISIADLKPATKHNTNGGGRIGGEKRVESSSRELPVMAVPSAVFKS